jgi:hypothetical protein
MGTCPKCDQIVGHVNLVEITAGALFGDRWRAVKYCCPHCRVILSVGIDPVALKTDTVEQVPAGLRRS